jgi:exodeoxyribonuclease V beta subunit
LPDDFGDLARFCGDDPFIERLFASVIGASPRHAIGFGEARLRLLSAVRAFDQAAIHTIHGFCQRVLQEAPFAAGLPFEFELVADDNDLCFEAAVEFWHTQVEPLAVRDPSFANWLVDRGAHPLALDAQLKRRLKKPLGQLRWGAAVPELPELPGDVGSGMALAQQWSRVYAEAAAIWHGEQNQIASLLERAAPSLKNTSHKPELVGMALAAWAAYFSEEFSQTRGDGPPRAAARITQSSLEKGRKKEGVLPEHPFFIAADALRRKPCSNGTRGCGSVWCACGWRGRYRFCAKKNARSARFRSTICSPIYIAR